jgi:RNA polymerase sigma-70 factor (ECF subfamily)
VTSFSADDSRSDEFLVASINRGDESAFEALYRRYRDWVLGLARRVAGNDDDALDVLQETFVYLLGKVPHLRLEARLTTFLYPVVRHLAIAAAKRRRRHAAGGGEDLAESRASAPESGTSELEVVLASLSDAHREIVLLRFVDDLSLEEIAEIQGIPIGTVKSRLHYAIGQLRDDPRVRRWMES